MLDKKHQMPTSWQRGTFKNNQEQELRYGYAVSKHARGHVVLLHGLSEFTEKYFETINDLIERGLSVWTFDWRGQGLSERYLLNRHKRHSAGFEKDVEDLSLFIDKIMYQKHQVGSEEKLIMLGHSTGANIGLHYLYLNPQDFSCAAFTSPLMAIYAIRKLPRSISLPLTALLKTIAGEKYIFGGHDWSPDLRNDLDKDRLTLDPQRREINDYWCNKNTDLQVGNITIGWLYHALRSCLFLQEQEVMEAIETPTLALLAGDDEIVCSDTARKSLLHMPNANVMTVDDAKHEILMERDSVRSVFFNAFDKFIKQNTM